MCIRDSRTDPVEQRRRFTLEMAEKQRIYGETYPLDEDFLAALALICLLYTSQSP